MSKVLLAWRWQRSEQSLQDVSPPKYSGVLVAIEGIDGAGKTTLAGALAAKLEALGVKTVLSKEPTNGPHGKRLRDSAWTGRLNAHEELEEFIADRRQHVAELVLPALRDGKVVILDRYYFSTAAYQGIRGLDWQIILERNEEFAPQPDVLLILDIDPLVGIKRVNARDGQANHFEHAADLEKARHIFNSITRPYAQRLHGIESPADLLEIALRSVMKLVVERLALREDVAADQKLQMTLDWMAAWPGTKASRIAG